MRSSPDLFKNTWLILVILEVLGKCYQLLD
jgi:hypothetical protein